MYRHTPAQSSFAINMLAIRGGRPELLNLHDVIEAFVNFREEVITRRSKFELNKARERAHLLLGLVVAVTNLDEVVRIIRAAATPAEARAALLARTWDVTEIRPYLALVEAVDGDADGDTYRLSDLQVRAILDLRLAKLTALGRDEIGDELKKLAASIADLLEILRDRAKLYAVLRGELDGVRPVRHQAPHRDGHRGRRHRRRGPDHPRGHGRDGDDDRLHQARAAVATIAPSAAAARAGRAWRPRTRTSSPTCSSPRRTRRCCSSRRAGKVYRLKVWKLPLGGPTAKGRPMLHLLPLAQGETITTVLPLPEDEAEWSRCT